MTLQEQPAPHGTVRKVRIVVAPLASLQEQCRGGKFEAVDILVDERREQNAPYHCGRMTEGISDDVLPHAKAHNDERTILKLSYKDKESALWYSDREFAIVAIEPLLYPGAEKAPRNPFEKPISSKPATEILSGPITSDSVGHKYKITLQIGSRTIDPDLWCNP